MSAATFDTLTAARELEAAGLEARQAEAIVTAIRNGQGDLATKADAAAVRSDVAAARSDVAALRSELGTVKWVVGIQSAITLATFAAVLFLAAKLL